MHRGERIRSYLISNVSNDGAAKAADRAHGSSQLKVSVCICTRNRPDELRRCLDSLRRSSRRVDETIVSDDSTDDRTARMLAGDQSGLSVRYIRGPRRGLGANRNSALQAAGGDYILFLDDDACLGEHFLERALDCAAGHGGLANERIVVSGCENNRGIMVRAHDQSFLGFQSVPYGRDVDLNTIVINSTLFPRTLFDAVRFDEHLVYGCDEVDVALHAVRCGYKIVQSGDAVNFHYPSEVNRSYYKPHLDVSRLYITFKRYAIYERAYGKALAFAVLAPTHCMLAAIKRRGFSGIVDAWKAIGTAARFSAESLRTGGRWQ
jgi:glycosyltransferase involved in cell wall biosynthesis